MNGSCYFLFEECIPAEAFIASREEIAKAHATVLHTPNNVCSQLCSPRCSHHHFVQHSGPCSTCCRRRCTHVYSPFVLQPYGTQQGNIVYRGAHFGAPPPHPRPPAFCAHLDGSAFGPCASSVSYGVSTVSRID